MSTSMFFFPLPAFGITSNASASRAWGPGRTTSHVRRLQPDFNSDRRRCIKKYMGSNAFSDADDVDSSLANGMYVLLCGLLIAPGCTRTDKMEYLHPCEVSNIQLMETDYIQLARVPVNVHLVCKYVHKLACTVPALGLPLPMVVARELGS